MITFGPPPRPNEQEPAFGVIQTDGDEWWTSTFASWGDDPLAFLDGSVIGYLWGLPCPESDLRGLVNLSYDVTDTFAATYGAVASSTPTFTLNSTVPAGGAQRAGLNENDEWSLIEVLESVGNIAARDDLSALTSVGNPPGRYDYSSLPYTLNACTSFLTGGIRWRVSPAAYARCQELDAALPQFYSAPVVSVSGTVATVEDPGTHAAYTVNWFSGCPCVGGNSELATGTSYDNYGGAPAVAAVVATNAAGTRGRATTVYVP